MAGDYCVYWNSIRDQFHVAKTQRALRYHDTVIQVGLSYEKADSIRQEANESYVKELYEDYGKDVI